MTALTQAKSVMEGLAGKTLAAAKMENIVNNILYHHLWQPHPKSDTIDMETATNEEKAQLFIDISLTHMKQLAMRGGETKARADNLAVVQAARDAAIADL